MEQALKMVSLILLLIPMSARTGPCLPVRRRETEKSGRCCEDGVTKRLPSVSDLYRACECVMRRCL